MAPKVEESIGEETEVPKESEEVQALKAELKRTRMVKEKAKDGSHQGQERM